jgi:RNA polymerase sigma-70 factor (ECF subfamily)
MIVSAKYTTFATDVEEPIALTPTAEGHTVNYKDEHFFEEAYNLNHRKIIFFAFKYLGDMGEAENIANDVFTAFWNNLESVEREAYVSYLFATAKNKCLNVLRRREIESKYADEKRKKDQQYLNLVSLESFESTRIYETEITDILNRGIDLMKPKVRRTFILSRFNGLKNKEIAEIEGIAESTVEARMSSALLIMRKLLNDYL